MEERCELCEKKAMVHCDSDHAKLCWGCDERVHSANFLVEKHMRVLLRRICNSHTQWKACGPKLIPSNSFCHLCVANGGTRLQHHVVDDDGRYSSDDSESDSDDDDDINEEEDDEENQVVPLYSPSNLDPLRRWREDGGEFGPFNGHCRRGEGERKYKEKRREMIFQGSRFRPSSHQWRGSGLLSFAT